MAIHQIDKCKVQVTHIRQPSGEHRVNIAILDQQGTIIHQTGEVLADFVAEDALANLFPDPEAVSAEDLAHVMADIQASPPPQNRSSR